MSLPPKFVEAIFSKLTLIYGQQFLRRWQDLDLSVVKDDWAHELDGLDTNPKRIAYALQNLPIEKPPTVLEFRAIALKMPSVGDSALLEMDAHKGVRPSQVIADAICNGLKERQAPYDFRAWAHKLKSRHEAGDKLTLFQIRSHQTALTSKQEEVT